MPSARTCLITGVGGFLGSHLAEHLLNRGCSVVGTVHRQTVNVAHLAERVRIVHWDLRRRREIGALLEEVRPDEVYHLAAQSIPMLSWRRPSLTLQANVLGTLYLLDALRKESPGAVAVVAGSSAEYGQADDDTDPLAEERSLRPLSPYGVSKVAADLLAGLYGRVYGLRVVRARLFFVTGPRKTGDVCSDFARGVAAVEAGRQRVLRVGNLEVVRDFLDVRDAVQALVLLAERGAPGEVYNVCSGKGHSVEQVLRIVLGMSTLPVPVKVDPARLRTSDEPVVVGDNTRIRALGWQPNIPLEQTLAHMLAYWRGMIRDRSARTIRQPV